MNMQSNNDEQNEIFEPEITEPPKKSVKRKSFYAAVSICIAAISVAAWSTYEGVKKFVVTPKNESKLQNVIKSKNKQESKQSGKTAILEETAEEKSEVKNRKLIPYDIPPANNGALMQNQENLEDIQAVSAATTDAVAVYPAGNNVTKEFSAGNPIYSNTMGDWRTHDGTDFKAEKGSVVRAISSGVVKDIYADPSYGTTIVIDHSGQFTAYYSGLGETTMVQKGQQVEPGQDIGCINKVPCEIADEPHLHLAIFKDEKFIDPLLILDKEN